MAALDEGNLGAYFTPSAYLAVTLVSAAVAVAGLFSNVVIVCIFCNVYGVQRLQSALWINLSSCQIAQCVVILYDALGTHVSAFSSSQFACMTRYSLPISMDQVFLGCYLVLLTERMAIVHFASFHSLLPKLTTVMLLYGWAFGFTFLVLVHNDVMRYVSPLQCLSPYLTQFPQESATVCLYFMTSLVILTSLVSVSLSVPQSASRVEQLRQEVEGKGVTVTLFIGSLLVLLSAPRHILSVLYWMDSIGILYFQVLSKLTSLLLRLNVLLPFIGLMMRVEFRSSVQALASFKSLDTTRKKIVGQETYISTVQKMVLTERKKIADKRRTTSNYTAGKESSSYAFDPRPRWVSSPELKPRNEISLAADESIARLSVHSTYV